MTPAGPVLLELVQVVANSATFARSTALKKLLLYLAEHSGEALSEYSIAIDVFAKREDFDPRIDATVRVQVSRLRQKLKEHYEKEGSAERRRIVIPAGGHKVEIQEGPEPKAPKQPLPWVRIVSIAAGVAFSLVVADNVVLRGRLALQEEQRTLPPLWQAMLNPSRLTRIIYPIPVFYNWDRLRIRDVDNNDPEGWRTSARLAPFVEKFGPPLLSQSYSVSSDTAAAIQLTRFLSERRAPLDVSPTGSLSLDQYGNENLIFMGIPPTNAALDPYLKALSFRVSGGGGVVANLSPRKGEPHEWVPRREGPSPPLRYGIIAVVPGQLPGSRLLLLLGLETANLAAALTAPPSLANLTEMWRQAGESQHFEAVIETEVAGDKVRQARVKAFRVIPANR